MTALSKATITIKKIFDNGQGKPSKIIDTQDGQWKVWHDVLEQLNLKEGSAYDIGYAAGEYKGKPERTIKAVSGAVDAPATNGHAQAPVLNGHAAPLKDEIIAALAVFKPYAGVGAVALDDDRIAEALLKCLRGYRKFIQIAAAE